MIAFRYIDGFLRANSFDIVQITKPFSRKARCNLEFKHKGFRRIEEHSIDSMVSLVDFNNRVPGFHVKISDDVAYSLIKSWVGPIRGYSVWRTNTKVSHSFRSIALRDVKNNLWKINRSLVDMQIVITLLEDAYPFDNIVVTDPVISTNFKFKNPVHLIQGNLTGRVKVETDHHAAVNGLLNTYKSIPLSKLHKKTYGMIPEGATDLDPSFMRNLGNVLFLGWDNPYEVFYIRYFYKLHGYSDIMPVSLFFHSPSDFKG